MTERNSANTSSSDDDVIVTMTSAVLSTGRGATSAGASSTSTDCFGCLDVFSVVNGTATSINDSDYGGSAAAAGEIVDPAAELNGFPYPSLYSWYHIVLASLVVTVIMLAIIVGNGLVVIAIAVDRNLRGLQNWFIASLAVSDLLVGLFIMPLSLANELMGYWAFGDVICELWLSTDVLLCTASILNLCLISIDRYWSITRAITYVRARTPRRAAAMISVVWALSMVICLPPLVGWKRPQPTKFGFPLCVLSEEPGYVVYSSIGSFYLPLIVMVLVYFKIYLAARDRARRNLKAKKKFSSSKDRSGKSSTTTTATTASLLTPAAATASNRNNFRVGGGNESPAIRIEREDSCFDLECDDADEYIYQPDVDRKPEQCAAVRCEVVEQNLSGCHVDRVSEKVNGDQTTMNENHHAPGTGTTANGVASGRSSDPNRLSVDNHEVQDVNAKKARMPPPMTVASIRRDYIVDEQRTAARLAHRGGCNPPTDSADSLLPKTPDRRASNAERRAAFFGIRNASTRASCASVLSLDVTSGSDELRRSSVAVVSTAAADGSGSPPGGDTAVGGGVGAVSSAAKVDIGRHPTHVPVRRPTAEDPEKAKRKLARARERRATVVLGIVMASFIGCWLPFFSIYPITSLARVDVQPTFFAVIFWLGYCNSALNPIIYTIFNREFRVAFVHILCGRRRYGLVSGRGKH